MDTSLHAQDILVAMKLAVLTPEESRSLRELSASVGISKSAVAISLKRLQALQLLRLEAGVLRVNRMALRECLQHALKWLAPATLGPTRAGFPTSHNAPSLKAEIRSSESPLVIPHKRGPVRGRAVSPIHPMAPFAASQDPRMQQVLALSDAFRVGRTRERAAAAQALTAYI